MLLSLIATPALASAATPDTGAARANLAEGTTALDPDAVAVTRLAERIVGLEERVGQLGVAEPPTAKSSAELKRAKQEEERQAEFQRQVWTMP